jgi:hypothetical protein
MYVVYIVFSVGTLTTIAYTNSTRTDYEDECDCHLIKYRVMLSHHIGPVNLLGNRHELGLGNDHRLIEVLLKYLVKSIINVWFFPNNP